MTHDEEELSPRPQTEVDLDGTAHADLVARVRVTQHESDHRRRQWHRFCDTHAPPAPGGGGAGIRDPARHPTSLLLRFFEALEDGSLELPEEDSALMPEPGSASRRADPEAVEAALKRVACESGSDIWQCISAPWRPLYEAPLKLCYDAKRFDFVSIVREMLDCPEDLPLSMLHQAERHPGYEPCPALRRGMLLAGMAPTTGKSKNKAKKDWKNAPAHARFIDLYLRFVREEVLPALGAAATDAELEAAVQCTPVLRVMMPSPHIATKPHKDADYGHIPEELNFWLPLTKVWGGNSLFTETFPGRADFQALEGDVGDIFRFWGNQCSHYTEPNNTGSTRVSFDFRVIPRCFWDAAETAGTLSEAAHGRIRRHTGEMRLGSYYTLERAAVAQPAQVQP